MRIDYEGPEDDEDGEDLTPEQVIVLFRFVLFCFVLFCFVFFCFSFLFCSSQGVGSS